MQSAASKTKFRCRGFISLVPLFVRESLKEINASRGVRGENKCPRRQKELSFQNARRGSSLRTFSIRADLISI